MNKYNKIKINNIVGVQKIIAFCTFNGRKKSYQRCTFRARLTRDWENFEFEIHKILIRNIFMQEQRKDMCLFPNIINLNKY